MTTTEPIPDILPNTELAPEVPNFDAHFFPHEIRSGEPEVIDTSVSLYDPSDIKDFLGFEASIPAVIQAGDKQLMVVDLRSHTDIIGDKRFIERSDGKTVIVRADFLLIDPEAWSDGGGYKGVRENEPVTFGSSPALGLDKRFNFSSGKVSPQHFQVKYSSTGKLTVTDLHSKTKTTITKADYSVDTSHTFMSVKRVKDSDRYTEPDPRGGPYGYLDGDPILGHDSPKIAGGVYLGGGAREAITVKPNEDPRIEQVYRQMSRGNGMKHLARRAFGVKSEAISVKSQLENVLATVKDAMKYDGPAVKELSEKYYGDKTVSLGDYIQRGIGVCRHQALLSGYILERMVADGKINGKARIERNTIEDYGGSHAWASFTVANGETYVIDPAQSFVGTKKEARQQARWDYYLPLL